LLLFVLLYLPAHLWQDVPNALSQLPDNPLQTQTAPPLLGQHSDSILEELGYGASDIAALRGAGAI
jgi:crotonobetainyl-CoA:carnitine CoA-transferase CaiB-like acyl-CoA transferase